MKTCDLHTHSIYSDGTLTPEELINLAVEEGLSAVALTDHDSIDGLSEFLKAAEGKDITAVPGVEFSVDYSGKELHLLALFIPEAAFGMLSEFTGVIKTHKEKNRIDLITALNRDGYKIDGEKIKNRTPNGNFNRAHIAAELVEQGYANSIKEAFDTLLSSAAGYYKEPERPNIFKMLTFVKEIGAVSVLAHPLLNINEYMLEDFLPKGKAYGLAGIECFYSEYDEQQTKKSIAFADRYGLKYSGGSDFHGDNKKAISLGRGKGNLSIPYSIAENLSWRESNPIRFRSPPSII